MFLSLFFLSRSNFIFLIICKTFKYINSNSVRGSGGGYEN